jgi:hypothetical protein
MDALIQQNSLLISLLAGNLVQRPVRNGLHHQPAASAQFFGQVSGPQFSISKFGCLRLGSNSVETWFDTAGKEPGTASAPKRSLRTGPHLHFDLLGGPNNQN